ncbi:MAG: ArsR/SmtB family transcription factor [Planctomycetota bacterium]
MPSALVTLTAALKLLSDPVRLRLCALLARGELAVHELVAVTGLQQSRVSNHLALLKRARLVRDRREGTWSFHSLIEPSERGALSPQLFVAVIQPFLDSADGRADQQALRAVLEQRRERSRQAHDRLADRWDAGQDFATGSLRAEIMAQALPAQQVVADLGCGAGFLTAALAQSGARVLAIDHSARMLGQAQQKRIAGRVEFRRGELDALPIGDGEVDAAFANLVWHHLPDFAAAAGEVFRILRPGGVVVIADLLPHEAEWMRDAMGDLRLGLRPEQVVGALARAGFADLHSLPSIDRYRATAPDGAPVDMPMFLVRGQRPAAGSPSSPTDLPTTQELSES